MERIKFTDKRCRASWGSIIGGAVTVLAVSALLSILATSIGLFQFDPQSEHPASGIGITVSIFSIVSLLLSLAAGGFVAGKLAGSDGIIHGFLAWATSIILSIIFVAFFTVSAVRITTNVLGSVTSAAGNVLSGVGSVAERGVSRLTNEAEDIFSNIDFSGDINRNEIRGDIRQALRKSGVKEFQPEYLQRQMKMIKSDFNKSVKRLATHPNDADKVINNFLERTQKRIENAFKDVDRNDLTRAIANNTNLTQAEVDNAVDEYIILYNNAVEEGREQIDNLQQSIEEAKLEWNVIKQNALYEADQATNAAGRAALWSFIALLIGGGIAALAGFYGAKTTKEGYEV